MRQNSARVTASNGAHEAEVLATLREDLMTGGDASRSPRRVLMDAILRDFPYSFETERLTIRGPLPGDGPKIREAILESKPELQLWMPWAVNVGTEEEYEALVRNAQLRFLAREDMWMILLYRERDMIIGGSGLHRIDWNVPKFEIGYWARTKFTGQGLISEAVKGISKFAFELLKAQRLEIRCDARNERSKAIPRRLGFTLEGTIRHDSRHHITNELRDTMVFAKLAKSDQV